MRILYYEYNLPYLIKNSNTPFGGASVDVYAFLKGFDKDNNQCGVLTWKGANAYVGNSEKLDFELIESFPKNTFIPFLQTIVVKIPCLLYSSIKWKPDVITTKCPGIIPGVLSVIAKVIRAKFVYQVANDVEVDDRIKTRLSLLSYLIFAFARNTADYIRCQNKYQYDSLVKMYNKKKVFLVYNPIFVDQSVNIEALVSNNRSYFAWVGTFRDQKNIGLLLDVAKSLPNINFKIAGSIVQGANENTKSAIENLKLLQNVEMVGFLNRNDVFSFLSHAYALLNTSDHEGFPNTYLESWSVGTPVVCSVNSNPDSIVENNKIGVVCSNLDEYIDGIQHIATTGFSLLSDNCVRYMKNSHNPKKVAEIFLDAIK